jgi:hypothetical protein
MIVDFVLVIILGMEIGPADSWPKVTTHSKKNPMMLNIMGVFLGLPRTSLGSAGYPL